MSKFNIHSYNAFFNQVYNINNIYINIYNILKSFDIYFASEYNKQIVLSLLNNIVPSVNNMTDNRKELLDNTPVFIETLRYFDILLKENGINHNIDDIVKLKNLIYLYVNYQILREKYDSIKKSLYLLYNMNDMIDIDCYLTISPNTIINPYYIEHLKKTTYNFFMFNTHFNIDPKPIYKSLEIIEINSDYQSDKIILGCLDENEFLSINNINNNRSNYVILIEN